MKRRYLELALLSIGVLLLGKGVWSLATYSAFERHPEWFFKAEHHTSLHSFSPDLLPIALHASNGLEQVSDLQVLGKLEVPRLGMSVLVVEGDNEEKLSLAAGHLSNTAPLGQEGNSVVAGHRDTSFWPLRKIRLGDRVRVRAGNTYDYVVNRVQIVSPEDVSVLVATPDKRSLTLITCYPFRFIGSAPKRFIVQATIPHT